MRRLVCSGASLFSLFISVFMRRKLSAGFAMRLRLAFIDSGYMVRSKDSATTRRISLFVQFLA